MYCKQTKDGIAVGNEYFETFHSRKDGGAWSSLVFKKGTGKNLLAQPISSHFKFANPPRSDQMYHGAYTYEECLDKKATLRAHKDALGNVIVVSEGRYTRDSGKTLPARFKRTFIYNKYGLAKSLLQVITEEDIPNVAEFGVLEMFIREGMNKAFVKHHPKLQEILDFQGSGWIDIPKKGYTARAVPSYIGIVEQNVEGIEIFPGSDYYEWDNFSGIEHSGITFICDGGGGKTQVGLNAHCMVFLRVGVTVSGAHTFELNFGIPFIKPAAEIFQKTLQCGTWSQWAKDSELKELADAGVKLMRFHNDYRENGPFWHDGMYPPYDKKGMRELARVIKTSHKLGMKIVPYISLKEFHPDSPGYKENHKEWQRKQTNSEEVSHTYFYTGQFGGLMCMKSGWLERRKRDVDTILKDLPWDGLYFDWCTYHPCCNKKHASGWHTDANEFLDFVKWCRERIGKKGFLFIHLSLTPSMVCENMADLVCVGETSGFGAKSWDPEYYYVPIVQKMSAKWGVSGTTINFLAMSGLLEGAGPGITAPMDINFGPIFDEYRLFAGINLEKFGLKRASEGPVRTGDDMVGANLYYSKNEALIYAANLANSQKDVTLSVDLAKYGVFGSKASIEKAYLDKREHKKGTKAGKAGKVPLGGLPEATDNNPWLARRWENTKILRDKGGIGIDTLAESGLPVTLPPFSSMLIRLKTS